MEHIIKKAIETVEELSGITFKEFTSQNKYSGKISRKSEYVLCRRMVAVLCRSSNTPLTLIQIARAFPSLPNKNMDHSTIIHALNNHEADLRFRPGYAELFETYMNTFREKLNVTPTINEQLNKAYETVLRQYVNTPQF